MIIFNRLGLAMFLASFALASVLCSGLGVSGEGPLMIAAGPILALGDLAYRSKWGSREWFRSGAGASLFFLPAWVFGVFWFLLGLVYAFKRGA